MRFCEYFNHDDPETDASLQFGAIAHHEFQALPRAPERVDCETIRKEIRRIVD